jgi:hypothetical protein
MTTSPAPPPVGDDFPNFSRALETNLPLLCTILVGVTGLLFVTVATVENLPKHDIMFRLLPWRDHPAITLDAELRNIVMVLSLVCSLLYIVSGYFSVVAQMFDHRAAIEQGLIKPHSQYWPAYERRLDKRRRQHLLISMYAFNISTIMFPLPLLLLLQNSLMSGALYVYVAIIGLMGWLIGARKYY